MMMMMMMIMMDYTFEAELDMGHAKRLVLNSWRWFFGVFSIRRCVSCGVLATQPADLSITNTRCHQQGCNNHASCFIYPYCYEHIDRKIVDNVLTQNRPQLPPGNLVYYL
jgi:hypothetical protein